MNTKERKRQRRPSGRSDAQLVFTQPKAFNRNRFLLQLATVLAVVLALVFGMSIFFKVETVNVAGVNKYTEYEVFEASGVSKGENLLSLSKSGISSKIMQKLPYVSSVRVGIRLPGTVNIEIEELTVTYAIEAQDGSWWLMDSHGKLVEKITGGEASAHTKLLGVTLEGPAQAQQAVAYEPPPTETDSEGQTIPVTVLGSQRLNTAITILQFLEQYGILGQAASVDVTDMGALEIWYGQQYQIMLGNQDDLAYKLKLVKGAINQMGDYRSGTLDVSFEIRPDEVIYTPFE